MHTLVRAPPQRLTKAVALGTGRSGGGFRVWVWSFEVSFVKVLGLI